MKKFLLSAMAVAVSVFASAQDLNWYIVGAFNTWNVEEAPAMTKNADGKFEFSLDKMASGFKIVNAQAWNQGEWGSVTKDDKLVNGETLQLTDKDAQDICFDGCDAAKDVKIVLDPEAKTLTATFTPVFENPDLWLVGSFPASGWSAPGADSTSPKFAEDNGIYTLVCKFEGEFTFKVSGAGWAPQWGLYGGGDELCDDIPDAILDKKEGKDPGDVKANFDGTYTVTFDINTNEIVFTAGGSGIEGVAADNNAPAVYYNLQGVQVANPVNGLYIVKQGNKVSKVLVK